MAPDAMAKVVQYLSVCARPYKHLSIWNLSGIWVCSGRGSSRNPFSLRTQLIAEGAQTIATM